ncbi:hypothetical protein BHM03_00022852 [Ensete ventricosum]|nr:hypothetical protein BHM03_00022852 [Ensete ventricosum]
MDSESPGDFKRGKKRGSTEKTELERENRGQSQTYPGETPPSEHRALKSQRHKSKDRLLVSGNPNPPYHTDSRPPPPPPSPPSTAAGKQDRKEESSNTRREKSQNKSRTHGEISRKEMVLWTVGGGRRAPGLAVL